MKNVKKIIAIVAAALCFLTMGGCADMCLGICVGLPMSLCINACTECNAGPYPFIHEPENFDNVKIELATVHREGYSGECSLEPVVEIEDKELFMEEFGELRFTYPYEPISGIGIGEAICFTYPDGQVEVVTRYGCGLFTDSTLRDAIGYNGRAGGDGFTELWNRWAYGESDN